MNLRAGRPLRKRRRRPRERSRRYRAPGELITKRRPVIEQRTRIGDVEGDLIIGSRTGTLVDRTSRLVRLVHVPAGHSGDAFAAALTAAVASWDRAERKILTWDQGIEMAPTTPWPTCSPKASTSRLQALRGNAAPTKTATGCYGSTFRKVPTYPSTHPLSCNA